MIVNVRKQIREALSTKDILGDIARFDAPDKSIPLDNPRTSPSYDPRVFPIIVASLGDEEVEGTNICGPYNERDLSLEINYFTKSYQSNQTAILYDDMESVGYEIDKRILVSGFGNSIPRVSIFDLESVSYTLNEDSGKGFFGGVGLIYRLRYQSRYNE